MMNEYMTHDIICSSTYVCKVSTFTRSMKKKLKKTNSVLFFCFVTVVSCEYRSDMYDFM